MRANETGHPQTHLMCCRDVQVESDVERTKYAVVQDAEL